MLAQLIGYAARHPGVVMMLTALAICVAGLDLSRASLDIFPEFAGPKVIIQTEVPGYTAEQVESLATRPIEQQINGIQGLQNTRSESIQGLSVVTAVFEDGLDIYRIRQAVNERLALLTPPLPPGVGSPVILPLASASATVLTAGLTAERHSIMALRDVMDFTLLPRLLAVPGVADVNVFGGGQRQLQIQVQGDKLIKLHLSLNDVATAARLATAQYPAGFIETPNQRLPLQIAGMPSSAEMLRDVMLARGAQGQLRLTDIATVVEGERPAIGAAAINHAAGIVFMVIGQYGANTLQVSRNVETVLDDFQELLARQGITLHPRLFRPADYVERSIENLGGHLVLGGLFVWLVLYAFLADWRSAMIPALAIPLSLLAATVILLRAGVNLNIMVLGGLAIALGEVVDDAIIDTENAFRRLAENRRLSNPRRALDVVFDAAMEVRGSVVYASFIVMLVFAPLLTLEGVAGRLFAPMGLAYITAIGMSLVVALSVTPALCVLLLGPTRPVRTPRLILWLQPRYSAALAAALRRPFVTSMLSLAACGGAMALMPGLGGEFLPALREGHFIVHTANSAGTALAESMRLGALLRTELKQLPGVESVSQWAGRAERGADTYGTHYSEYEVRLKPSSGLEQAQILDAIRAKLALFAGTAYEANTFLTERIEETLSGYTAPIVVNLYGNEWDALDAAGAQVANLLRSIPEVTGVQTRSITQMPGVQIRVRPERLAQFGMRPGELAEVVRIAFEGQVTGLIQRGSRRYEVSVILSPEERRDPRRIADLPIKTEAGVQLRLGQLADIEVTGLRYNILHRNSLRVQTITAQYSGRDQDHVLKELKQRLLREIHYPPGVYPELTGAAVEQARARLELTVHALLAGGGVLLLIYLALKRLRLVALTLINLPFAFIGGVVVAVLQGGVLSIGATVGFVTLFGITLRNSIMLISHYRHLVENEGCPWNQETVERGARERLPSIVMTGLVTALAMLPIAVNSDNPGREIMGPMAGIIIGGLISSTGLNLLVLPAAMSRWGKLEPSKL